MKRLCAALALCLAAACSAQAEGLSAMDLLKPIWLNALEQAGGDKKTEPAEIVEPAVISGDERFEVVRCAVYMDDRYGCQAQVYAEIRNLTPEVLSIDQIRLTVRDGDGLRVHREDYVGHMPEVVMPGETFFVSEWLYDFAPDLSRAAGVELTFETSDFGYRWLERLGDDVTAQAWTQEGELHVRMHNTTQEAQEDLSVIAVLTGEDGKILDVIGEGLGVNTALDAGSAVIFRRTLADHVSPMAAKTAACEAYVYRMAQ